MLRNTQARQSSRNSRGLDATSNLRMHVCHRPVARSSKVGRDGFIPLAKQFAGCYGVCRKRGTLQTNGLGVHLVSPLFSCGACCGVGKTPSVETKAHRCLCSLSRWAHVFPQEAQGFRFRGHLHLAISRRIAQLKEPKAKQLDARFLCAFLPLSLALCRSLSRCYIETHI